MSRQALIAAALCAVMTLNACGAPPPVFSEEEGADRPRIAYVPIDDRTDNVGRVVDLAESLGYRVVMPEKDLYRTRLDAQPRNKNGTAYGDRGALLAWVEAQDAAGCDLFLLSVDQLLSGGLVSSRTMGQGKDISMPNGEVLSEMEAVSRYFPALAADADNQVYLLDTVMRLASTMGYGGGDLSTYNALRDYAALPRPHLSGENLQVETIAQDYLLSATGEPIPLEPPLTQDALDRYVSSRQRKLSLSEALLQTTAETEGFHYLVGVDDSSSGDSIQTNEIAFLREKVVGRGAVLSGVDDLAIKALAKFYASRCQVEFTAAVRYFGESQQEAACIYDAHPLVRIMQDHLDYFGVEEVEPAAADVQILVLTAPKDEGRKAAYYGALIDALNQNEQDGVPTILVNAGNGLYGQPLHDALAKRCHLGAILSYSGFHDMAIATGSALSYGFSRYLYLRCGDPDDGLNQKAFVRTLTETVVKDLCYKSATRLELMDTIRAQGGSPDNFNQFGTDVAAMEQMLTERMAVHTKPVLKNLARSNFLISLDPVTWAGLGEITLDGYGFPWNRVFEITMDIHVEPFTAPHGRGLFW